MANQVKIISSKDFNVSLWPGDDRSQDHVVRAEVEGKEHNLSFNNYWYNCGATGTRIKCSCGFETNQFSGHGCWQQGHEEPEEPQFDEIHEAIVKTWGGCWD